MSGILTVFFIGLIIASFMFTGNQSLTRSPKDMAIVGNYAVKIDEFSREYNRQLELYGRMLGRGKEATLTRAQIRQYNIRENTLNKLIDQKLLLNLADELGINPSSDEVKEKIKEFSFFQTDKKFDINKYKTLLKANALSLSDFEGQITHGIKEQAILPFIKEPLLSRWHLDMVQGLQSQKANVTAIQLKKNSLQAHIPISSKAISRFLNGPQGPQNLERVKQLFRKRKSSLDKPEQIKASHILFKGEDLEGLKKARKKAQKIASQATPQNFAKLANAHTEDPSGKGKGGALGWFARGKMVPDFEKIAFSQKPGTISKPIKTHFGHHIIFTQGKKATVPAKFGQYKEELAKEILQKEDAKGLSQLISQVKETIQAHLKKGDVKAIDKLKKKYNLRVVKEKIIHRLEDTIGPIFLKPEQAQDIFRDLKSSRIFVFDDPVTVTLIKKTPFKSKTKDKEDDDDTKMAKKTAKKRELARYENTLSRRFNKDLMDYLKKSYKIKYYKNLN